MSDSRYEKNRVEKRSVFHVIHFFCNIFLVVTLITLICLKTCVYKILPVANLNIMKVCETIKIMQRHQKIFED